MSRSDTFDSDIVEVDNNKPPLEGTRSMPWISSPVLQNTTNSSCEALLDPRKLLCESSSIFALIPCRSFMKKPDNDKSSNVVDLGKNNLSNVAEVSSGVKDPITSIPVVESVGTALHSDLLSEIYTTTASPHLLSSDVIKSHVPNIELSSNVSSVRSTEPKANSSNDESAAFVLDKDKPDAGLPAWCFEGDDSFRDVIDAINRLCDTMSSGQTNVSNNSEESSFVELATQDEERITEQPKYKESPMSLVYSGSSQCGTSVSETYSQCVSSPLQQSPESVSTPGGTTDEAILPDSSIADSSSPAVIEDDSSTNQTDILQYSMCSSGLLNDDSGMYLSAENHLPNPEEAPPPGHVAAMRIKFETITTLNVNTVKMLKKSDEDT